MDTTLIDITGMPSNITFFDALSMGLLVIILFKKVTSIQKDINILYYY